MKAVVFARHLCVLVLLLAPFAAEAQRPRQWQLQLSEHASGRVIRDLTVPVVREALGSTVRVRSDGRQAALGLVVHSDGYIVTKASEVRGEVTCDLLVGGDVPAEVVARDDSNDLALLKVDQTDLPTVRWNLDTPVVGQFVVTPDDSRRPVALGVVSVLPRRVAEIEERGVLGVTLADDAGPPEVVSVFDDSGAYRAGIEAGDVIVGVAGQQVSSRIDLIRMIGQHRPGDQLELLVSRNDEELTITATLTQPLGDFAIQMGDHNHLGGRLSNRRSGFPVVLQHDTVLRPEDVGGPLLNLDGEAVGLNIARAGRTESYAIPAKNLAPLIRALLRKAGVEQ